MKKKYDRFGKKLNMRENGWLAIALAAEKQKMKEG
jgi:hypothetical protein